MLVKHAEAIFSEALQQDAEKREDFVKKSCGNHTNLEKEVLSLLRASDRAENYFDDLFFRLGQTQGAKKNASGKGESKVGPWRLLRLLGRGGMGRVYLAERADHQYKRQVALKILPMGADDPLSRFRFTSERQILASLTHNHIARFLDGGVTEEGVPYFVMDYIDGLEINQFCEQKKATLEQRLSLFLDVCGAVDYAHRKLVIHRDIKPGNVLVDNKGQVKLLDFGIAKFLDDSSLGGDLTKVAYRPVTRSYASPEMLRGETVDISCDIYSLGIMLYELLTGQRPFDDHSNAAPSLLDLSERKPKKPSRVVSNKDTGRKLQGDLDTIVLKAIKYNASQRYNNVESFMDDIKRFLSGYPIQARADTTFYHVSKFFLRHKTSVIVSVLLVCVLSFSSVFSFVQMLTAQKHRNIAQAQQVRVQASNEFLNLLLEEIGPQGQALTIEQLLGRGVSMLDKHQGVEKNFVGRMYYDLASSYLRFGNYAKSLTLLKRAEKKARQQKNWDLLAAVNCTLAEKLFLNNRDLAQKTLAEAQEILAKKFISSVDTTVQCVKAQAMSLVTTGKQAHAITLLQQAKEQLYQAQSSTRLTQASLLHSIAKIYYSMGEWTKLFYTNGEILRLLEESGRDSTLSYLLIKSNRAILLDKVGEVSKAQIIRRDIQARLALLENNTHVIAQFTRNYASGLMRLARYEEALNLLQKNMKRVKALGNPFMLALHQLRIGKIHAIKGNFSRAEKLIDEATLELNKNPVSNRLQLNSAALVNITILIGKNRLQEAANAVYDLLQQEVNDTAPGMRQAEVLCTASHIALLQKNFTQSESMATECVNAATLVAVEKKRSGDVGYALLLRGQSRLQLGKKASAKSDLEDSREALSNGFGEEHPHTLKVKNLLHTHYQSEVN